MLDYQYQCHLTQRLHGCHRHFTLAMFRIPEFFTRPDSSTTRQSFWGQGGFVRHVTRLSNMVMAHASSGNNLASPDSPRHGQIWRNSIFVSPSHLSTVRSMTHDQIQKYSRISVRPHPDLPKIWLALQSTSSWVQRRTTASWVR